MHRKNKNGDENSSFKNYTWLEYFVLRGENTIKDILEKNANLRLTKIKTN